MQKLAVISCLLMCVTVVAGALLLARHDAKEPTPAPATVKVDVAPEVPIAAPAADSSPEVPVAAPPIDAASAVSIAAPAADSAPAVPIAAPPATPPVVAEPAPVASVQAALPPANAPQLNYTVGMLFNRSRRFPNGVAEEYRNFWLNLTGNVVQVGVENSGDQGYRLFALLEITAEDLNLHAYPPVRCYFKQAEPPANLSYGKLLKVRCVATGNRGEEAILEHGEFLQSDGEPLVRITAAELAAAVAKDPHEASAKYHKKLLVVSGNVLRAKVSNQKLAYWRAQTLLAGQEQLPVAVHCRPFEYEQFSLLREGDTIKAIGVCLVDPEAAQGQAKVGLQFASRLDLVGKQSLHKDNPPVPEVAARDLMEAYDRDSFAAKFVYEQDLLDVTGYVDGLDLHHTGGKYVCFLHLLPVRTDDTPADDPVSQGLPLMCRMIELAPWKKVGRGATVTLRGRMKSSFLVDGQIMHVEGEPALQITAEELARLLKAKPGSTRRDYDHKTMVLTGTILQQGVSKLSVDGGYRVSLVLDGLPGLPVGIHYGGDDGVELEKMKVGERVTVFGESRVDSNAPSGSFKLGLFLADWLPKPEEKEQYTGD